MTSLNRDASLYDLLEVGSSASGEEIETSYRRIVAYLAENSLAIYSMLDDDQVETLRANVEDAFRTLSDPDKRARYDETRKGEGNTYPSVYVDSERSDANLSVGAITEEETKGGSPSGAPAHATPEEGVAEKSDEEVALRQPPVAVAKPASKRPLRRLRPDPDIVLLDDTEYGGSFLRRLRESARASLEDVAEITKISRRYIKAIEEHDFASLPAPVYVRGFVSEYAKALGLDPKRVSKSYMGLYERYKEEAE